MRMPQFQATSVPGWPPIVTGSTESGVSGHVSPWIRKFSAMPRATQGASRLVVGAAAADTPKVTDSPAGPNTSTAVSMKFGAPTPFQVVVAGSAIQPIGSVIEYR